MDTQQVTRTPGPWTVTVRHEREGECKPGLWIMGPKNSVFDSGALDCFPLSEPDRLLIQASPELLDACIMADSINNYIESCDLADDTTHPLWPIVVQMRAAVDKATGR